MRKEPAMFLLCIWRSLVQKICQAYYMVDDFFLRVRFMVLQRWMKICSDGWKKCTFIMLYNGSPLGSSLFFSPSAQATALVVEPQNMEEMGGLPLCYKVNQIYSWQPSPHHAWHLKYIMELAPSLMYPVFPKHDPWAFGHSCFKTSYKVTSKLTNHLSGMLIH